MRSYYSCYYYFASVTPIFAPRDTSVCTPWESPHLLLL